MTPAMYAQRGFHRLRQGLQYSLRARLLLVLLSVLAVAILGMGWRTASQQTEHTFNLELQRARNLVEHVVSAAKPLLLLGDLSGLEELLLRVAGNPDVVEIDVSGANLRVLAQVEVPAGKPPQLRFTDHQHAPPKLERDRLAIHGARLELWQPVDSNERLGWVRLRYDLSGVEGQQQTIITRMAQTMILATLAGIALMLTLLRGPLRALTNATDFARALHQRGGETLSLSRHVPTEILRLQDALNDASRALHRQRRELEESTAALRNSEQRLADMVQQAPDAIIVLNVRGQLVSLNHAAEHLAGRPVEQLVGRHFGDIGLLSEKAAAIARSEFQRVVAGETRGQLELPLRRADGQMVLAEVHPRLVRHEGREPEVQMILRDITERKRKEEMAARLGRVLDASSNEIYVFDADTLRFIQVNEGAQKNLGYRMEQLQMMTPVDIKPEHSRTTFEEQLEPLRNRSVEVLQFETHHRRADGSLYPVEVRLQLSHAERPPVFVAVVQDISQRQHTEARLHYLANFDTLTGLPNRARLGEHLARILTEADRHHRLAAVMFLDLDKFKTINDSLGHEAGDAVLKAVADGLGECVRPGDCVARLGGDEFVVALANVNHVEDVAQVADKIVKRLSRPVVVGDHELVITPSIGVAVYPLDEHGAEGLLKFADIAMYHAKEQGRNNYQFFTSELNTRMRRRMSLQDGLRSALTRGELRLAYQPQMDIASGGIVGAEALMRWHHPEWGPVSPAEFIPLAEESGLIQALGEWAIREACRQARAWAVDGTTIKIAVNVSTRQLLDGKLSEVVRDALGTLPAAQLELEITESLFMKNFEEAAQTLTKISELGVSLSLDDFGTGYSSLAYLRQLPIDSLKIDRTFVEKLEANDNDAAIARTMIVLAKSLGMWITAEGVETVAQLEFLRRYGCDTAQGYYIAKPLDAADFQAWLTGRTTVGQLRKLA